MSEAMDGVIEERANRRKRPDRPAPDDPVPMRPIRKLLVANRGEIACRVLRTCRDMGIATVAVFSDADASARHVREADEAARLHGSAAADTYLNIPALIAAAQRTGADSLHPGYGFLAENAVFATACRDAGITFVGPAPEAIAAMGSKREAKRLVAATGVPVVPGYEGEDQSDERFFAAARTLGFPVMIKASAGGGGKGMRVVASEAALAEGLAGARREAHSAFGDGTLLLEKAIVEPRHVEFQIFGDAFGTVIHLGERECTIQRRHQKIIEETPSTALTPQLRARMGEAAVAVGRTLGYTNAGTVEFILAPDGQFYFLEVNTRLQVEHPVTELATGLDLVRWQLLVAEGRPLPLAQDEVRFSGHAVEARIYAEDPAHEYLPMTGTIALWREPVGVEVRVDAGIQTGDVVTHHYDPLVAKVSAHGADRDEALRRLERALARTVLFGVRTNLDYLRRIILHPSHAAGEISTAFVEHFADDLLALRATGAPGWACAPSVAQAALVVACSRALSSPLPGGWRNNRGQPLPERFDVVTSNATGAEGREATSGHPIEVRLMPRARDRYAAVLVQQDETVSLEVVVHGHDGPDLDLELDGCLVRTVVAELEGHQWWVKLGDDTYTLVWRPPLPEPERRAATAGSLVAPMPGQVVSVLVREGQRVRAGEPLIVLEAMKMEHTVRAPADGVVVGIRFATGDKVAAGDALVEVQPLDAPQS